MNLLVVGLLVGLWAWVLLPGLRRERNQRTASSDTDATSSDGAARGGVVPRTGDTSGRRILVLSDPERVVSARTRSRAEVRRRALLARGGFVVALAVAGGFLGGGWWWLPAGVLAAVYVPFVLLAVRLERRLAQQREMLHDLAEERRRRHPAPRRREDDGDAIELIVGDASGILVTGWQEQRSPRN